MYRKNTPADVANTGRVHIDTGDGVQVEVPASLAARLAALEQDTGERSLTGLIPEWVSGDFMIRRVGKAVYLSIYDLELAPNSGARTWSTGGFLPAGFRFSSPAYRYFSSFAKNANYNEGNARFDRYGGIAIYDVDGLKTNLSATWITGQAFPATLPGSPA